MQNSLYESASKQCYRRAGIFSFVHVHFDILNADLLWEEERKSDD